MVVDEKGTFRDDNFQSAVSKLHDADGAGGKKARPQRLRSCASPAADSSIAPPRPPTAATCLLAGACCVFLLVQKAKRGAPAGQQGEQEDTDAFKIVKMIMKRNYDPVRPASLSSPMRAPPPHTRQSRNMRSAAPQLSPAKPWLRRGTDDAERVRAGRRQV